MDFPGVLRVMTLFNGLGRNISEGYKVSIDGHVLKYLAENLKFRYKVRHVRGYEDLYYGLDENKADVAIALQGMDDVRFSYADFTAPYHLYDIRFMAEKPSDLPKYKAFFYPFSSGVWIACVVVAFAATLLTKWITKSKTSLANTFLSVFGSMLRQPLNVDVTSLEKTIWWTTWLVWATIMSTAYSALFLSFLAAPGRERGVRNFQELSSAVQRKKFSCLIMEGFNSELLVDSSEEHLRTLGEAIAENEWFYDSKRDIPEIGPTQAVIGNREYLEDLEYYPPNRIRVYSEDSLTMVPISISVRKNFCCLEQLNLALLQATATGLVDHYVDQYFHKLRWEMELRSWAWQEETASALTLEDLKYVFFMLLIGHSLALIVFLCEVFIPKRIIDACHRLPKRHWGLWFTNTSKG